MTGDVTSPGGGFLTEAPRLSPELSRILGKRKVVPEYGTDEDRRTGGGQFRAGVWDPPEFVDARDRDEAKAILPKFDTLLRPASPERIREFLLFLWNSTKHQSDMDWQAVASVYPMMLDSHPSWCFRPERLKLAAQTAFEWFPSVAELCAFMEPDRQDILERVEGLRRVVDTPTTPPKGGTVDVDESIRRFRERQDRERAELRAAAGIDLPPPLPRAEGESDRDYGTRLAAEAKRQCEAGGRALKRAERPVPRVVPRPAEVRQSAAVVREALEHGPPPPPQAEERLGGMMPDYTDEDSP